MKIFLSYASSDSSIGNALAQFIIAAGEEVIRPQADISVGSSIVESIVDGIQSADVVVFMITKAALTSQYFNLEVSAAVNERFKRGKRILPVILERDVELPPFLRDIKGFQFFDARASFGFNALLSAILSKKKVEKVDATTQQAAVDGALSIQASISATYEQARSRFISEVREKLIAALIVGIVGGVIFYLVLLYKPSNAFHAFATVGTFFLGGIVSYIANVVTGLLVTHRRRVARDGRGNFEQGETTSDEGAR